MTQDDLRAALRQHRLEQGWSYQELYNACKRRRVSKSAIHRFLAGHAIAETGTHGLHKYWLSVLDKNEAAGDQPGRL